MTIIPPWRYHHHHLLQELRLLPRPFRVQCVCQSWRSGFFKATFEAGSQRHSFGIRKLELCTLLASQAHPEPSARTEFSQAAESRQWGYAIPSGHGHVVHSIASAADARARRMPSSSHREQRAHADRLREGGGGGWPAFKQETKQKSGSDVQ